jgi:hypothetical protein
VSKRVRLHQWLHQSVSQPVSHTPKIVAAWRRSSACSGDSQPRRSAMIRAIATAVFTAAVFLVVAIIFASVVIAAARAAALALLPHDTAKPLLLLQQR